jgi:hypothetical protein
MMADDQTGARWQGDLIDAYCHAGVPKYGSVSDALRFFDRLSIRRAVIVLGPGIPDLASLAYARRVLGDNVRIMGIPFGETASQRLELGDLQIRLGVSGMRLMPDELEPNRELLDRLGEAGLCLYAINPFDSRVAPMHATRFLLDWLERHPTGSVASPHFLRPQPLQEVVSDYGLFCELLEHPRYHAIFSRQGGVGSSEPYPHQDLLPWVEQVAEHVTWKRILWGSEFPIIYQRSEQPEAARDWLVDLGVDIDEEAKTDFYAGNARRLFFNADPPEHSDVSIPAWVEKQVDATQTVYLFPNTMLHIPMDDHGTLLSQYMELTESEPELTYADFVARLISNQAAKIRAESDNA